MNSQVRWLFFDFSDTDVETLEFEYRKLAGSSETIEAKLSERRAPSFLAGRIALHTLLKVEGLTYSVAAQTPSGFLELRDKDNQLVANRFCNLSHTENVSVAILSTSPVGIDIEKRNRSPVKVISKIASQTEIESVRHISNELCEQVSDPLLFLWTAKEAFSKALGLGLTKDIHQLEISFQGPPPFLAKGKVESPLHLESAAVSFFFKQDYLIAICTERDAKILTPPLLLEGFPN